MPGRSVVWCDWVGAYPLEDLAAEEVVPFAPGDSILPAWRRRGLGGPRFLNVRVQHVGHGLGVDRVFCVRVALGHHATLQRVYPACVTDERRVELWTLRAADAVRNGARWEDSRVEFKASWPSDHGRAARRIAGHANAAAPDEILWIFGFDEEARRTETLDPEIDPARWWAQVGKFFDQEITPEVTDLVVPISETEHVVAFVFRTTRAPYVVKNYSGKGHIDREVPWRELTSTRSARRTDLMRVLAPSAAAPEPEILHAKLAVNRTDRQIWAAAEAGVAMRPGSEGVALLTQGGIGLEARLGPSLFWQANRDFKLRAWGNDPDYVDSVAIGLRVRPSGMFTAEGAGDLNADVHEAVDPDFAPTLTLNLTYAGSSVQRVATARLQLRDVRPTGFHYYFTTLVQDNK